MSWDIASFKEKLEAGHSFPGPYIFKFIVPMNQKDQVIQVLPKGELSTKHSATNKYISITLKAQVEASEKVIEVYQRAYEIKGIVAL